MRHNGIPVILAALLGSFAMVAAAMVAGPATAAPRTPAVRHTAVVAERPVDARGDLRPGFTVTHRVAGKRLPAVGATCSFGSEAVDVAYRCFAGNYVIDPCWVAHNRSYVYCQLTPWGRRVTKLHVRAAGFSNLGYTQSGGRKRIPTPWALQLTDGKRRVRMQGAGCTYGTKAVRYGYDRHRALAGNVERTSPLWRIQRVRQASGECRYSADGYVHLSREWIGQASRKGAAA